MRKLLREIAGTIFWSYDRGSWPYDVMVVIIVIFVLISPRSWFRDQPQDNFMNAAGIVLLTQDPITHIETYQLDRALFGKTVVTKSNAALEEKTHQILAESVAGLKGQRFQVRSIEPVRRDNGSLLYYEVEVKH